MRNRCLRGILTLALLIGVAGLVAWSGAAGAVTQDDVLGPEPNEGPVGAHVSTSSDIGTVAELGNRSVRASFEQAELERAIADADADERQELVDAHLDRLSDELDGFRTAERESLAAYHAGELTIEEFTQVLLDIQGDAIARQATLDRFGALVGYASSDAPPDEAALTARYGVHTSPVRSLLIDGLTARSTAYPVAFVHSTPDSVVVASVSAERYHREAIRFDREAAQPNDRIERLSEAETIATDAYPNSRSTVTVSRFDDGRYLVERTTDWGGLTAYVDGTFEAVSRERQSHWLDAVIAERHATNEEGELVIETWRSYDTGPMMVEITDADGTPIAGTVYVRVDGRWAQVGQASPDRPFWTVAPSEPFDIRVVTDRGVITITHAS